ncbi:lysozyme inhibitor LprI family protein [Chromobacterium paludis]|uniref:DUF1311 domain-containing protein n=1 Tax=Chromobacterium paludis TaxID=2605945 RepID=A0A5C1DG48_9NEIS|nr:lysozyme inhibitor LprI family protein [Chromobacterium paludis]QEL55523.1 DUF1311 domain-containing protein [Chromobacterium paludis]
MRSARLLIAALLMPLAASAGALDECTQRQPNTPAIAACLQQRHADILAKLQAQEDRALEAMRKLDAATDNRFHAARELRRARQAYEAYRRQQCDWVEASYASGNGAGRARQACEIDLDTQRLAELGRQS